MLSSIHPLGERGKGNRFATTATAFVVGATLGGVTTGALVGALGLLVTGALGLPEAASLAILAVVALAAAVFEGTGRALPSPLPRQVDENWLNEYRGWVYGAGFGFQLGAGLLTFVTTAAIVVAVAAAVLAGSFLGSVVVMGTFGLVRGLSVVPARAIDSPQQLMAFHRRLHASAPLVRRVSTSTLTIVALVAGATLLQELS